MQEKEVELLIPEDLELRSEEVQEILTRVPSWMIRQGSVLFLFLILGLLFLSWLIKYPDVISSQAMITTQIPPQKEYAKTSGTIIQIMVKDGDTVQANTPLAVIENTATYQDVVQLKKVMDTLQVNKEHFTFPFDSLPILFLGGMETAYAAFENSYNAYKLNQDLQPYDNQTVNDSIIATETQTRLEGLELQQKISRSELRFKKKELDRYRKLFNKGAVSEQEYDNQQLAYLNVKRAFRDIGIAISQLKENVGAANKNIQDTEISRTREETQLFKEVIQNYQMLKKAVKDWQQQYVLESKMVGTVSFMKIWNTNQYVNAGDLVCTVLPINDQKFIAKLKTPAQNSGKVKVGQRVNLKLANYPEAEFGMLQGKVGSIGLIPDAEGFYSIDVVLPKELVTTYQKTIPFTQEMPAIAEIITEDLRLIERFFYQFRSLMKQS